MSYKSLPVLALCIAIGFISPAMFQPVSAAVSARAEASAPDLYVTDIKLTHDSSQAKMNVDALIGNFGAGLGRRHPVVIHFLTGDDEETADFLGEAYIFSMSSGHAERVSMSFPDSRLSGKIYIKVDPYLDISELDESNNHGVADLSSAVEKDASNSNIETTVKLDSDSEEILTDSMARFIVSVAGIEVSDEYPFMVFSVENEAGDIVHQTGEIPLFLHDVSGEFRGEVYWSTLGQEDGEYTLLTTIQNSAGILDKHKKIVSLISLNSNHAPVAEDDEATTRMDQMVEIDLLQNDYEPDGHRLEHYVSQQPKYGEVSELRGTASYTPNSGFVGIDRFIYQLDDTHGGSDWAEVTISVLPPENGCTWVRDFTAVNSGERISEDGWADFNLQQDEDAINASWIRSNDNPDLFEEQPHISFPSCSLYFKANAGATGSAKVTYVVLDKATGGKNYVSELRTFTIEITDNQDQPEIITTPTTMMQVTSSYGYQPQVSNDRTFELYALSLPDFLSIENGVVTGSPTEVDIGMHSVQLILDFGSVSVRQSFLLTVTPELSATLDDFNANISNGNSAQIISGDSGGGSLSPLLYLLMLLLPALRQRH